MKRRIYALMIAIILVTTISYSQVSFGLRGGVNFQNINGKDADDDKLDNKLRVGFLGGVEVAFPVATDFFVQSGLLYNLKGAKADVGDGSIAISYLELPIHLQYKPTLGTGKLIVGFGPYLAYAIGGKFKGNGETVDINFTNDASILDSEISMRPFDAGADIFFGYEFAFKLSVQLNAQLGLMNLLPKVEGEDPEATYKNTGFSFTVGYRIK